MITISTMIAWFIFLNACLAAVVFLSWRTIAARQLKQSFLVLLTAAGVWINMVILIQYQGWNVEQAALLFKILYTVAILVFISFGIFAIRFAELPREFASLRYWLLTANLGFVLLSVFTGLIITGAEKKAFGFVPRLGILNPYVVFSIILYGLYIFYIVIRAYRKSPSEFLRVQLKGVFIAGFISFVLVITTNGLLPFFLDRHDLAPTSAASTLFFMVGVLYTITRGKQLFLRSAFNRLLKEEGVLKDSNIYSLRRVLDTIRFAITEPADQFERHHIFETPDGETRDITIKKGKPGEERAVTGRMPRGYLAGLLENMVRLERDNKRLALSLERAGYLLNSPTPKSLADTEEKGNQLLPVPTRSTVPLTELTNGLEELVANNRESFGVEVLALEGEAYRQLMSLRESAVLEGPYFFSGEPGSGKATLARILNRLKFGVDPVEIDCLASDLHSIDESLRQFYRSGQKNGLLLRHLDSLSNDSLRGVWTALAPRADQPLYVTVSGNYLTIPGPILYELTKVPFRTIPLRERPADIQALLGWFVSQYAPQKGLEFQEVTQELLDSCRDFEWPGNIRQLENLVQRALFYNRPPVLSRMDFGNEHRTRVEAQGLTPLEESEKQVILQYLQKNKFNKNKTRIELGITVNTLNAKIDKYGLAEHFKK